MPNLTQRGRRRLQGNNTQRRRTYRPVKERQVRLVVLPDGSTLNKPESIIYYALQDLKEPFEAQKRIGQAKFGSGLIDFFLPRLDMAIEYQGAFHDNSLGKSRDFFRRATREKLGYYVVYLYERDLDEIHGVLRDLIGGSRTIAGVGAARSVGATR